jgi:AraC-like DNA-binding protein
MPALDLIDVSERFGRVPRLMTTRVETAVSAMSERYRPHRLSVLSGDRVDIDFSHQAVALDRASINILRYGPDVVIDAGDFDYFYMLEIPLAGGVDLRYGERSVSSGVGRALFLSPGPSVLSHWRAGTTQLMLRVERGLVEHAFARCAGSRDGRVPVFAPEIDLDTAAGRRILALLSLILAEQVESAEEMRDPPAATPLIDAILATLFTAIPFRLAAPRPRISSPACPYYVRRLRAILDEPSALTLSVTELAARIGVSDRTLAKGTRRFMGVSPFAYLTHRRMEHARDLLERREYAVSRIAAEVGYGNAGRFASVFKSVFGIYPSRY